VPTALWHNDKPTVTDQPDTPAQDPEEVAAEGASVLRKLMAQRAWTAADLARQSGMSASSVRAWRSGKYVPSPAAALNAARIFDGEDGLRLLEAWGLDDAAEGFKHGLTGGPFKASPRFPKGTVNLSGRAGSASSGKGTLGVTKQVQISEAVGITDEVTHRLTHTISYEGPPLSVAGQALVARFIKIMQEYEATPGGEGQGTPSRLMEEALEEGLPPDAED